MATADHHEGPVWLDDLELRAWRGLNLMMFRLVAVLGGELFASSGMSMQEYTVLAALSDQEGQRMRASDLARWIGWERSRLSHQLARMESRGLVERTACPVDRRGTLVAATDAARDLMARVAPGHVEAVRAHFLDGLSREELATLAGVAERVLARLAETGCGSEGGEPDPG